MDYILKPVRGYTDKIGELVFMLEHVRAQTVKDIEGLQQYHLDEVDRENGNSIGALLAHITAIEKAHQLLSFDGRDFTEVEFAEWEAALLLGEKAQNGIKGNPLDYYIKQMNLVRKTTLRKLRKKSDAWLYEEHSWQNGIPYNMYYLWFHVIEDEINHRGQIRVLKRRLLNEARFT